LPVLEPGDLNPRNYLKNDLLLKKLNSRKSKPLVMIETLISSTQKRANSSKGKYEVGTFAVGDRIQIQPQNLSSHRQYLAYATGEIKAIKGSKASVLLDEPSNKSYKSQTIKVDLCSLRLISAQEWEQDSRQQESLQEDSNCKDSAKLTNSAANDCAIASQVSPSTPTCENSGHYQEQQTSSQLRHHAPHSQLKENGWEALTSETVSPQSCDKLDSSSPSLQLSKTCLDCYQLPLIPEPNPAHISNRCSGSFGQVGTMRNGLLSEHKSTTPSGKEKGSCLLPRPGALSKSSESSRPPGNTKSEAAAKKLGIIQKNEVFNPEWLEIQFGLPQGWTSPQEHRAATALLAPVELPSEIVLTPDLQRSLSKGYSTSTDLSLKAIIEPFAVKGKQGLFNISLDIFQSQKELTELLGDNQINPSNDNLLGDIESSPSKNISPSNNSPSKKRGRGFGNGYIHWRTITKKGKDYPQAYYHWKENGNKRSKYISKHLLGVIQEAEEQKRPVIEILELLGVAVSPSKLLGDIEVNPSNLEVLGDIEISPSNLENSPSNHISPSNDSGDIENSPSNEISPSKTRRHKGEGSGCIHWRIITKGCKDYPQAYYHYEFWNGGDRLIKSTKYIPKRLLSQVQQLEQDKAPVREILGVLGVVE
jgi:hypothetical protein